MLLGMGIGNAGAGFAAQATRATRAAIPVVLSSRVVWSTTVPIYGNGGGVDLVQVASGELNAYQSRILPALLIAKGGAVGDFAEQFGKYI